MQIKSFLSYLYFKMLEKDIYTELDNTKKFKSTNDYKTSRDNSDYGKLGAYVEFFKNTFQDSFTKEQSDKMLHAINSLKIRENERQYEYEFVISLGSYDSENNIITINNYTGLDVDINKEEILIHELLHMASTNFSDDGERMGLDLYGLIGSKLNEGYTEYLTRKYFTRGYKYTESSENNIILAKGIENIIGSDNMEKYYFESDLNSLINDLTKYISKDNAIKLLYLMDRLPDSNYKSKDFNYLIQKIAEINKIKIDKDLEEGTITQKEYEEQFAIKVREYSMYEMWSEDTKVLGDENTFMLYDHGYTSNMYAREKVQKKQQTFKKTLY